MTSWKKYGGKDKFDNMNNLTVNTLVCENFVMRSQYFGDWKFTGSLDVAKDAIVRGNLNVYSNSDFSGNVIIRGKLTVLGTDISGNVGISEDLYIKRNIYLGPDTAPFSLISGTNNMIGINKQNTVLNATLDICGNMERTIDIHTSVLNNKNVIARNVNNQGITVNVEPTRSYMDFYVDNSMNLATENRGARIMYDTGGGLSVDASSAFRVLPTAIFSENKSDVAIGKEAVIIYDSSNNVSPYLYYYYNDLSYNSGDAANIVSVDYSSNVFMTMKNRGGAGLAVGGGYYPGNLIMGSLALTDSSNVKHSAMNIISGNLNKQLRTAIAVNKHSIEKDGDGINKYAMEINGPVKINHQEINVVADSSFEILGQAFYGNNGFAFGSPTKEGSLYNQYILRTSDAGFTWSQLKLNKPVDDLELQSIKFNAGYASSSEPLYLVGGDQNYLYYSSNYGTNFSSVIVTSDNNINIQAIYLSPNKSRLIIGGVIGANSRILNSGAFASYPSSIGNVSTDLIEQRDISLSSINAIDGFDNLYAYIVGGGGIRKFDITNNTYTNIAGTGTYYAVKFYYDGSNYHSIIVGTNSIYYSHNVVANSWNSISVAGALKGVYIVNAQTAYAVGDNGTIMFSTDGYATWRTFTYDELNYMGNASRLWNTNLKNVVSRGSNDLLITGTIKNYVTNTVAGESYIFDLFYPYFFNHNNYNVFEVSGNMVLSGDLRINDSGRLMTNNSSFQILPENASQIYIGNTTVGGKTNVLNNFDVCGNAVIYGNLDVEMNTRSLKMALGKKTIAAGYTLDISGNVSIKNGFIHQW